MVQIIKFAGRIFGNGQKSSDQTEEKIRKGQAFVAGLSDEIRQQLLLFLFRLVELECRIGLNISNLTEEELETYGDLSIFELIDSIYSEARNTHKCYLCDPYTDANAHEFNHDSKLCPVCQFKIANILQFFGVDPQAKLALIATPRHAQKAQFNSSNGKIGF